MKLRAYIDREEARQKGALTRIAKRAGVPVQTLWHWAEKYDGRQVPLERCVTLEIATDGEVTCEELRPDMAWYFAYLRARSDPRQSSVTTTPALAGASA